MNLDRLMGNTTRMKRPRKAQRARRKRREGEHRFAPQIETLEPRQLLAADTSPVWFLNNLDEVSSPTSATDLNLQPLSSAASTAAITPVAHLPLGSLIYESNNLGSISTSGEVDTFVIDLDAGQTLSVVADPAAGLTPTIELFDPVNGSLGSVTASGASRDAFLQTLTVATAGTYSVTVTGDSGTTGDYSLDLLLNAAVESESHDGSDNNELATAQDLDSSFVSLGVGLAERGAVVAGSDDDTATNDPVLTSNADLIYDASTGEVTVDATQATGGLFSSYTLSAASGLRTENFTPFISGGFDFTLPTQIGELAFADDPTTSGQHSIGEVLPAGLNLQELNDFLAGTSYTGTVGSEMKPFDLIPLNAPPASNVDYFSFTLTAGQTSSLVLHGDDQIDLEVELLDSAGNLLAISSREQGLETIDDYLVTATGTYYARVTGPVTEYRLVVTRDASFDHGIGDRANVGGLGVFAQDISASGNVLADVGDLQVDPFTQPVGASQTFIDGEGFVWLLNGTGAIAGTTESYDSGNSLLFFPSSSTAIGEQGFRELVYGPATHNGMEIVRKVYVSPDEGFVRYLEIVTNPNATARNHTLFLLSNFESGNNTQVVGTSSGDSAFNTSDNWLVVDDANDGTGTDALTHVFAGPGQPGLSTATLASDDLSAFYSLTLDPGETQIIMHFAARSADQAAALTKASNLEGLGLGALRGMTYEELQQVVNFDAALSKYYSVPVVAGDSLSINTSQPAAGPNEFVNDLDRAVELYDETGSLVASDASGALTHVATSSGTYYVRVLSENSINGEFALSVSGYTGAAESFEVTAVNPIDGESLTSAPTEMQIEFSEAVLLTSVAASDLTVNGVPATSVSVVDARTLSFTLPTLGHGTQNVAIAGGAITDLQGQPLETFSSQFDLDLEGPRIISSSIQQGDTVAAGTLIYSATFNSPIDPTNLDPSDVTLVGQLRGSYTPVAINYDAGTMTFTAEFADLDLNDSYTLTLKSGDGAFEDPLGNDLDGEPIAFPIPSNVSGDGVRGGDFVVDFDTDIGTAAFPVPLTPLRPLGSIVYDSTVAGEIGFAGDIDTYTLEIDDGQRITVVLATEAALQGSLELRGPGGALLADATATTSGDQLVLQAVATAGPGTYSIVVSEAGGTTGTFAVRLLLNTAAESESHDGASNDTILTAQSLDGHFQGTDGEIAAVVGMGDGLNYYQATEAGPEEITGTPSIIAFNAAPAPYLDGELTVTASGDIGNSRDFLVLDVESFFTQDVFNASGIGHYRDATIDVPLAALQLAAADGVIDLTAFASENSRGVDNATFELSYATSSVSSDYYSLSLAAGEMASIMLSAQQVGNFKLELVDAAGNLLATAAPGTGDVDLIIRDFVPTNAGTYYARVSGDQVEYQLTATRDAHFESLPNERQLVDGLDQLAQDISPTGNVWANLGGVEFDPALPEPIDLLHNLYDADGYLWDGTYFGGVGSGTDQIFDFALFIPNFPVHEEGNLEQDGRELVVGPAAMGDVEIVRKMYVSEEDGFARFLDIVTNTSGSPIVYSLTTETELDNTFVLTEIATSSGDETFDTGDDWIAHDNGQVDGSALLNVVAGPGGQRPTTATLHTRGVDMTYDLALAPGETQIVMQFLSQNADHASAVAKAPLLAGFGVDTLAGMSAKELQQVVNFDLPIADYYRVAAEPGDLLDISTFQPAAGTGEFVNDLDLAVALFNPAGTLVASSATGTLAHTAATSGNYIVRVLSENGVDGEYKLSVNGHRSSNPAFEVVATTPFDGETFTYRPTQAVVDFNDSILLSTVAAGDMLVNGVPATGVSVLDSDTLQFTLPAGLPEGVNTLEIAAGAITDLQNQPLESFSSEFFVDTIGPRIINSSVQEGDIVGSGNFIITVQFDEELDPTHIDIDDVQMVGQLSGSYAPVSVVYVPGTATLVAAFTDVYEDDRYTLTMTSGDGALEDLLGNDMDGEALSFPLPPHVTGDGVRGGDFVVNFDTDVVVSPFSTPLTPLWPVGSLVYETQTEGVILPAGDTDSYVVHIDDQQQITVLVTPDAPLHATVELRGPSGGLLATATGVGAGEAVILQSVPTVGGGDYTVTILAANGTDGAFSAQLLLNAALEGEQHDGANNDSIGSAENIDGAFFGPLATRAAVVGVGDGFSVYQASQTIHDILYRGNVLNYELTGASLPNGDGLFTFIADGDLRYRDENIFIDVEGLLTFEIYSEVTFGYSGPYTTEVVIPRDILREVAADGVIQITATPSDDVYISNDNFLTIDLSYPTTPASYDHYAFTLAAGEATTLQVFAQQPGGLLLDLLDSSGNVIASRQSRDTEPGVAINNFIATTSDTYYARVSGRPVEYNLVVTRDAELDNNANHYVTIDGERIRVQDITHTGNVLGRLLPGTPGVVDNTSVPVSLDTRLNDGSGYRWHIWEDGSIDSGYGGLFDDGMKLYNFPEFDDAQAENNGREIVIGPATIDGAEVSRKIFVSPDQGFARFLEIVTNPTDQPMEHDLRVTARRDTRYGTEVIASNSGDQEFGPDDDWFVTFDPGETLAPGLQVISGEYGLRPTSASITQDGVSSFAYTLSLEPGETQILMHFAAQSEDSAAALAKGEELFNLGFGALDGMSPQERQQVVNFHAGATDYYSVEAIAGDVLDVTTFVPAAGAGEFVNSLAVAIEIYDPSGALVASSATGSTTHTTTSSGTYVVRAMSANEFGGEYSLRVTGYSGAPLPFEVSETDPFDGEIFLVSPTEITVKFNDPVLVGTLTPADLTVDGIAATAMTVIDVDTVRFEIPAGFGEGPHEVAIAGGALTDLQNQPIEAYSGQFVVDTTAPRVISSSIQENDSVSRGTLVYTVQFNEELDATVLDPSDIQLVGQLSGSYTPTSFNYDPLTSTLTAEFESLADDLYTLTLISGPTAFRDLIGFDLDGDPLNFPIPANVSGDGTPGGDFVVNFSATVGNGPYSLPLDRVLPLGSIVYQSTAEGVIALAGEIDTYTVDLDAGQQLTVLLSADASLQGAIEIHGPGGEVIDRVAATTAGDTVILQAAPATIAGTYEIVITSASVPVLEGDVDGDLDVDADDIFVAFTNYTGPAGSGKTANEGDLDGDGDVDVTDIMRFFSAFTGPDVNDGIGALPGVTGIYSTQFLLNAALEEEPHAGTDNDTLLNAQNLDDSFFGPAGQRAAVVGTTDGYDQHAQSQTIAGELYANNLMTFNFSGLPVPYADGILRVEALGDLQYASDIISLQIDGQDPIELFTANGDFSTPLETRVNLSLAELQAATADGTITINATPSAYVNNEVGNYLQLDLSYPTGKITPDIYSFSLDAGQAASLLLTDLDGGNIELELLDSAGNVIAAGSQTTRDIDLAINNFVAPTAGTYYARIFGDGVKYNLLVTRDSEFDNAPREQATLAGQEVEVQDISLTGNVWGRFGELSQSDDPAPIYLGGSSQLNLHDGDGYLWDILRDGRIFDGTDNAYSIAFDHQSFPNFNDANIAQDGRELILGPATIGEVEVVRKIFVPTDQAYARFLEVVTNTSESPLEYRFDIDATVGSGSGSTFLIGSSVDDGVFDTSDNWLVTDDTDGSGTPTLLQVVAGEGGQRPSYVRQYSNSVDFEYTLQLAPGETQIVMHFAAQNADQATALEKAALLADLELDALAGMSLDEMIRVANFDARPRDYYSVQAVAGDPLDINALLPGSGTGQFVNALDIAMDLYDPAGNLVASSSGGPIAHTAALSGAYVVHLYPETDATGEYLLTVDGYTGGTLPFTVSGSDPIDGAIFTTSPTEITVDFSDTILLSSLQASDLQVDGIAATGMTVIDIDTVRFEIPAGFGEGPHNVTIAAGAILDLQSQPIDAYAGQFLVDTISPRVIGTSIQEGDTVSVGSLTLTIEFNEPMNAAGLDPSDVELVGQWSGSYTATSLSYNATQTVLTVEFDDLDDDLYTLTLISGDGAFEDLIGFDLDGEPLAFPLPANISGDGIEGGDFVVNFAADQLTSPFPVPFDALLPAGSTIYDSKTDGAISPAGDTDRYTVQLDSGQQITVVVTPDASLTGTVELRGPGGTVVATATANSAGEDIVLQSVATAGAGIYTVAVEGDAGTTGVYGVRMLVNAAAELESHDGPTNDTRATAQNIDGAFQGSSGQMAGVVGQGDGYNLYQDSHTHTDNVITGNVLSFDFTGAVAPRFDATLVVTASADLDYYDEYLTVDFEGLYTRRLFASGGINHQTISEQLRIPQADLAAMAADGTISLTVTPSSRVVSSSNFVTLDLSYSTTPVSSDFYSFTLDAGQSTSLLVTSQEAGNVELELVDATGAVLATASGSQNDVDLAINNFVAASTGTYYARVTSDDAEYSLVVTRDAEFDNNAQTPRTVGGADVLVQDISQTGKVFGSLRDGNLGDNDETQVSQGLPTELIDGENYLWEISRSGAISDALPVDETGGWRAYWTGMYIVDFSTSSPGTVEQHGREVVTRTDTIGDVEVARKVYISEEHGFARFLNIVTNPTASPVDFTLEVDSRFGSSSSVKIHGTSNPDSLIDTFTVDDDWIVTHQPSISQLPHLAHVVAGPGGQRPSGAQLLGDDLRLDYDLSLAPGETQIVMQFAALNPDAETGLAKAPRLANFELGVLVGMSPTELAQVVNFNAVPADYFSVPVVVGDTLSFDVSLPASGSGEFVNSLGVALELYDESGALVASASGTTLAYTAATGGNYTIKVLSENGFGGEYMLTANGYGGTPLPFEVVASDPVDGAIYTTAPTELTIDFSEEYLLSSLDASDLTVDGIAATAVTVVDVDTVRFTLPTGLTEGSHDVAIASGAITDQQGQDVEAFASQFIIDSLGPRVVDTSIQEAEVIAVGDLTYNVTFNEEIDATNLDVSDVQLVGQISGNHTPVSVSYDANTSTLTAEFVGLVDDLYTLTVVSGDGAIEDLIGNDLDGEPLSFPIPANVSGDGVPGGDFVVNFIADVGVDTLPVPLQPLLPLGSLIYETSTTGVIAPNADVDSWTLDLDPGQTITVVVQTEASLQGVVEVRGPGGSLHATATASAAGEDVVLQTIADVGAGTYTATVRGDTGTTGTYSVRLLVNAAIEEESHGGASNDTRPAAQDIGGSFIDLDFGTAQRGSVVGTADGGVDHVVSQTINDGLFADNEMTFNFGSLPEIRGRGVLTVTAFGELANTGRFLTLEAEGLLEETLFRFDGVTGGEASTTLTLSQEQLEQLATDGTISFNVTPSFNVSNWPGNYLTLELTYETAPTAGDYYRFDLAAGESVSLAIAGQEVGRLQVELFDATGNLLATGAPGDGTLEQVITNYVSASGGTYYARVAGDSIEYSLVATRNAEFSGPSTAPTLVDGIEVLSQDISLTGTVLGSTTADGPAQADSDATIVPLGYDLIDGDGFLWDIAADGSVTSGSDNAYSGGFHIASFTDVAEGRLEQGGREIVMGPVTIGDIEVVRKIFVSEEDGFVRYLEIVTNRSDDVTEHTVGVDTVLGSYYGGQVVASSTNDLLFDASDDWVVTDGVNEPSLLQVIAGQGAQRPTNASRGTAKAVTSLSFDYDLSLAPGETQIVMHFAAQDTDAASAAIKGADLADPSFAALLGMSPTEIEQVVNFDIDAFHFYSVEANAGDQLEIDTRLPAAAAGEFVNPLDIAVELYDPTGTLVGSSSTGSLSHTTLASGRYTVRVLGEAATEGEFVLNVSGHTGAALPFEVVASDPFDGEADNVLPSQITVDFSEAIQISSLDASDLTVDGVAATGVTLVDHDTATFDLPAGLSEGSHSVVIAGGAILDLQGQQLDSFASSFVLDTIGPRIAFSSIDEGDYVPAGNLTYTVQFSESIDEANLDASDIQIVGAISGLLSPTSLAYDNLTNILTAEFSGLQENDFFTLTMLSGDGAFEDLVGNDLDGEPRLAPVPFLDSGDGIPGGNFVVNFTTDPSVPSPPPPAASPAQDIDDALQLLGFAIDESEATGGVLTKTADVLQPSDLLLGTTTITTVDEYLEDRKPSSIALDLHFAELGEEDDTEEHSPVDLFDDAGDHLAALRLRLP